MPLVTPMGVSYRNMLTCHCLNLLQSKYSKPYFHPRPVLWAATWPVPREGASDWALLWWPCHLHLWHWLPDHWLRGEGVSSHGVVGQSGALLQEERWKTLCFGLTIIDVFIPVYCSRPPLVQHASHNGPAEVDQFELETVLKYSCFPGWIILYPQHFILLPTQVTWLLVFPMPSVFSTTQQLSGLDQMSPANVSIYIWGKIHQ